MPERSREETLNLAKEDPEFAKIWPNFRAAFESLDLDDPDILKFLRSPRRTPASCPPGITETKQTYTTRDGQALDLLVFKPSTKPSQPSPLIVHFHGGGYTIGSPTAESALCRKLVLEFNAVVVAPQYRLAPEHRFPTGVLDCWDAVQYLAANAASLGASPEEAGFIVGGISAGATSSSVIVHLARDTQLSPPITGLWFSAGSITHPDVCPDKYRPKYLARFQDECIEAPILNSKMKNFFTECLRPDLSSHMFCSMSWPTGHANLPKAYFQACGMDINRDDAIIYESILREEHGGETRIDVYPGVPHVFWSIFNQIGLGKKWDRDTSEGFAWLLSKKE